MKQGDIVKIKGSHPEGVKKWNEKAEKLKGKTGQIREVHNQCITSPRTVIVIMDETGYKEYFCEVHLTVIPNEHTD